MNRFMTSVAAMVVAGLTGAWCAPKLTWLESVHDFGAFSEDLGIVTCSIPFVNTGNEPLVITAARVTCGCTVADYPKDPVAPGDTASVSVKYNAVGRPGRFDKKVYVYANTTPERSAIVIKGVVIGASNTLKSRFPIEAGPMKLRAATVPFGQVKRGKLKTVFLNAYNQSTDTLTPEWTSIPKGIQIEGAPKQVPPGEQATFSFFVDTDELPEWGVNTGEPVLYPRGKGTADSVAVSTIVIVEEDFSKLTPGQLKEAPVAVIKPDKCSLGILKRDSGTYTAEFTIANTGKKPLQIRRVYTSDPAITDISLSSRTVKHGKEATLKLMVDTSRLKSAELLNARINIITNSPDAPNATVRVIAELAR